MDYKKSYRLFRISLWTMLVLMLVVGLLTKSTLLILIILIVWTIWSVYLGKFCRCPHCGKDLSFREELPDYCPHCGEKLE